MAGKIVACPHCGTSIEWNQANRFRPFCSERCKLIDLGGWASEQHRIAGVADEDDLSSDDPDRDPER
jgi:endogenous inhibitor of DNA gyrase (YacG/DUF329 family)